MPWKRHSRQTVKAMLPYGEFLSGFLYAKIHIFSELCKYLAFFFHDSDHFFTTMYHMLLEGLWKGKI